MAVPCAFSSFRIASKRRVSSVVKEAVGSSRTSSFCFSSSTLRISRILRSPILSRSAGSVGIETNIETLRAFGQLIAHGTAPNEAKRCGRLLTEGEVLGDRQAWKDGGILMNDVQPERAQQHRRWRFDLLAFEQHLPAGRSMDARQDLDESRFAGAVLAEKRVEPSGLQLQVDLAERDRRAKRLG